MTTFSSPSEPSDAVNQSPAPDATKAKESPEQIKDFIPVLPNYATGTYNMVESGFPAMMSASDPQLGKMIFSLRKTIYGDRRLLFVDQRVMMACINWIRDHVHEMKGFMHWEHDILSFYQFFLDHQSPEGWYYELIKQLDDPHWRFVSPKYTRHFPMDHVAATRLEIEADIEYLMVEGAVQIYRVTGDDAWMQDVLPRLEKGIDYMTSDPRRWDEAHGLVKRPFTIDTWDFTYGRKGDNRRIEEDTPMSIMHGDNSGVYQAMRQLAWLRQRFGDQEKAEAWTRRADAIRENMIKYLWNGRFFILQLHLGHAGADDLESVRLSLSNSYDMNRGVTTLEQSRAILDEYRRRLQTTSAFAEWFSIDPPYQAFGSHAAGKYVNGGIASYAGGELAKAAFKNGMEAYGWDILQRMGKLIQRDGELYFLYDPRTGENLGGGPSGWGAAAVLSAIEEGLAGVEDLDVQYRVLGFSPRWVVTDYRELRYFTGYELAKVLIDLYFIRKENALWYRLCAPSAEIRCHILLPAGKSCAGVLADGCAVEYRETRVGDSAYADFVLKTQPLGRDAYCWGKNHVWEITCQLKNA